MTTSTLETACTGTTYAHPTRLSWESATLVATLIDLNCGVLVRVEGEAGIAGLETLEFAFSRAPARRNVPNRAGMLNQVGAGFLPFSP